MPRRLAKYSLFASTLFLASGIVLYHLTPINPIPLASFVSSVSLLAVSTKAFHGGSTKHRAPHSEIIAISNFPRPTVFYLEDDSPAFLRRIKGERSKKQLDDLWSGIISFPFSVETKVSCPITYFAQRIMSSELSKKVAVLARSSNKELTILAGSTERELLCEFLFMVQQLNQKGNLVKCYALRASARDLVRGFRGYSPPLNLGQLRVPAGVLLGRWLLISSVHELKSIAKGLAVSELKPVLYVKLDGKGLPPEALKRALSNLSLPKLGDPCPSKFKVLLSFAPSQSSTRDWDLILELSNTVPETTTLYDGILFMRPAFEDEVTKLLPASLLCLSKSMSGKSLAIELKSRTLLTLTDVEHERA